MARIDSLIMREAARRLYEMGHPWVPDPDHPHTWEGTAALAEVDIQLRTNPALADLAERAGLTAAAAPDA